jgi:hypothetical protein
LAQPAILGWWTSRNSVKVSGLKLRYTNWVEMMCPCFSKKALELCKETFNADKSCWGIEFIWNKLLGFPKNKIAIIDEVHAIHTRPMMDGDNYKMNNISLLECSKNWEKNKTDAKYTNFKCHKVIGTASKNIIEPNLEFGLSRKNKIWPKGNKFKSFVLCLRNRYKFI